MIVANCPSLQNWREFLLGQVDDEHVDSWSGHLEQCPQCLQTLHNLQAEDTFIEAIRRPAAPLDDSGAAMLQRLSDRIEQIGNASAHSTLEGQAREAAGDTQELYDFLAPAQQSDEMGRLGDYRILGVIGAGGMGVVFKAEDTQLKRLLAIKAMKPAVASIQSASERFGREARSVAGIKNDHIITIHHVGQERGVPFLAMELLEGEALEDCLRREGKLSLAQALDIARQTATGLAAAHERGLIHRDIKPGNIWLEERRAVSPLISANPSPPRNQGTDVARSPGRVKILDFGLARGEQEDVHITREGAIVGTPAYMAPEQANGDAVDARADLYSLGCVLYRMATGQLPFKGNNTMAILLAIAEGKPVPPRAISPAISQELSHFMLRLLARKPAERPQSAREVVDVLAHLEKQLQQVETSSPSRTLPLRPMRGRIFLGITLASLLIAMMSWLYGGAVLRFATNKGELVVDVQDPNILVSVRQNKLIVHDKSNRREFELAAGDGEVVVFENDGIGPLTTKKFVLSRGGKTRVTVTTADLAKARTPAPPIAKEATVARVFPPDALEAWQAAGWQPPDELVAVLGETRQRLYGQVNWLVFSPDGKQLAAGAAGVIQVWGTERMECLAALRSSTSFSAPAFLNGGKTLARIGPPSAYDVTLCEAQTFQEKAKLQGNAVVIAASADGRRLAILARSEVSIWDVSEAKPQRIHTLQMKEKPGWALALSPDGRTVAMAEGESLRLWEPDTGKSSPIADSVAKSSIKSLAFSHDGRFLLACNTGMGRVFDLSQSKPVWQQDQITQALAISPDGSLLAVGQLHYNHAVVVYSLRDKSKPAITLPAVTNNTMSVAFSPDGKVLATGGAGGDVRLWNVTENGLHERAPLAGHHSHIQDLKFSADGRWLASAGHYDSLVRIWRWAGAGTEIFADLQHSRDNPPTTGVSLSPDGTRVLSVALSGDARHDDFYLWPLDEKRPHASKNSYSFAKEGAAGAFVPGSKRLALVSGEGLRFWDIAASNVPQPGNLVDGTKDCSQFDISADGKTLVVSYKGPEKLLRFAVYRAKEAGGAFVQHLTHEAPIPQINPRRKVIASPDGQLVGAVDGGGVWDVSGPQAKLVGFANRGVRVDGMAFSPSAAHFALAETADAASHIRLYDLRKSVLVPQVIWKLPGPCYCNPAFSPDGQYLVTGNGNGTMYVFRVPFVEPTAEAGKTPQLLGELKHEKHVYGLGFSKSGLLVSAGGGDRDNANLRFFDPIQRVEVGSMTMPGNIFTMAMDRDGRIAACAGNLRVDGKNVIQIVELENRKVQKNITITPDALNTLAVSLDGRLVVWDDSQNIAQAPKRFYKIHDLQSGAVQNVHPAIGSIRPITFSPDGRYLIANRHDNSNQSYDLLENSFRPFHYGKYSFSPDGRFLANIGSTVFDLREQTGWGRGHFTNAGRHMLEMPMDDRKHIPALFSAKSRFLAAGLKDESILIFSGKEWKSYATIRPRPWTTLAFSPDEEVLAVGTAEGVIQLWKLPSHGAQ